MMEPSRILIGDTIEMMGTLPEKCVQCCVTSPPYWGLRDYGTAKWEGGDGACDHVDARRGKTSTYKTSDEKRAEAAAALFGTQYRDKCGKCGAVRIDKQIGLEETPEQFVAKMVEKQVGRLAGRQDAVAMSEWGRFYNDDIKTFRPNPQSVWRDMGGVDWLVEASKTVSGMMQAGMFLIPKSLAEKAGPWNEELTLIDDFEYFCRLFCEAKEVLFVPETTLYYRSGMWGSLSARKSREARVSECESILLGVGHISKKR